MPAVLSTRRAHSQRYEPAATKFASTTGSVSGDGSIYDPWTLEYGLDHLPVGYTLYLRGGTYVGIHTATLDGTQESERRTLRSYPGEWAIIDSQEPSAPNPGCPLEVSGDYWTVRDLELTNSNTDSRVLGPEVIYPDGGRSTPLNWYGSVGRHINLLIHDGGNGIFWAAQANGGLSYGNILYNGGWAGSSNDRGHGNAYYSQNDSGNAVKRIENVISTNSGASSLRAESAASYADNYEIVRASVANAGATSAMTSLYADTYRDALLEFGSEDHPIQNITVDQCRTFELSQAQSLSNFLVGPGPWSGFTLTNNDFRPGVSAVLVVVNATGVNIQNNIAFGDGLGPGNELLAKTQTTNPTGTWNNNSYYSMNGTYEFLYVGAPGTVSFAAWKAATGFDAASTFTPDTYPPDAVYVDDNLYETGRSHVTIYNQRAQATTVSVSLTGTGLVSGDPYYIFNAMNPLAGPVASGTYSGASVSFPMTTAAAGSPADPVGDLPPGPSTFPHFGVFVVRKYNTMQRAA